jgi:hypothetical protein
MDSRDIAANTASHDRALQGALENNLRVISSFAHQGVRAASENAIRGRCTDSSDKQQTMQAKLDGLSNRACRNRQAVPRYVIFSQQFGTLTCHRTWHVLRLPPSVDDRSAP